MQAGAAADRAPVAVLPAYNIGLPELRSALQALADRGLTGRVLLVGPADQLAALAGLAPHRLADELGSLPALLDRLARWSAEHGRDLCGVAGIDEETHYALSRGVAERFGLAFADEATCLRASNKWLAHRAFEREGVPAGRFALVTGPDADAAARVGFPSVLKLLSGTTSQYLFRNDSPDELARHLARLVDAARAAAGDPRLAPQRLDLDGEPLTLDPRCQFLLEEYIDGDEFSCDFGLDRGDLRLLRVTHKLPGPRVGLFGGYLLLDEAGLERSGLDRAGLEAMCRGVARALGAEHGVCMVDLKQQRGALRVLEASIRPGISAFNALMYELGGTTSLALLVGQLLGEPLPRGPLPGGGAVAYLYPPPPGPGPATDAGRLEALAGQLDLISVHWYADAAAPAEVPDTDPGRLLLGHALLRRAGLDDAPALVELALRLAARGPLPEEERA